MPSTTPSQSAVHKSPVSGKVMTVRGPIDPGVLGTTLMHEHLFLDLRKTHLPHVLSVPVPGRSEPILTSDDFPATELALWEAKLDVGNIRAAKDAEPIADNYILADEADAVAEVMEFRNRGGGTVVDVTSIGLKRDPEALLRVSEATGLHIVMGTGYYQRVYHPVDMDQRSVEDLAEVIVNDVTEGVGGTGIRSGIIGEIGVNGGPIRPNEEKSIRAAGLASLITGAPISLHRGGVGSERHRTLDILEEVGVDLERVILGHSDEIVGRHGTDARAAAARPVRPAGPDRTRRGRQEHQCARTRRGPGPERDGPGRRGRTKAHRGRIRGQGPPVP